MIARPQKVYDFTAHARRQPTAPPPGDRIDAQLQNHADAIIAAQLAIEKLAAAVEAMPVAKPREATLPTPTLYVNAGGPYAGDDAGATATSADYAQVSIEWAEHMPDTIPPNVLAVNAISGDHWSSRWWANRAATIVSVLGQSHTGVISEQLTVTAPNTFSLLSNTPVDTGNTMIVAVNGRVFSGCAVPPPFYASGRNLIWSSTLYGVVPGDEVIARYRFTAGTAIPMRGRAVSLYYLAAQGQTVFPLSAPDRFSLTYTLSDSSTVQVSRNGARLMPDDGSGKGGFTVVGDTIALLWPAGQDETVAIDVWEQDDSGGPGGGGVTSVAGRSGDIVLTHADIADWSAATAGFSGGPPPPGPPASASLPLPDVTPHGGAISGQTLSCSQGFWSNIPTGYAYQWRRGGTPITGATAANYTLVDADAAYSVDCVITATNSVGSNSASSNAIAVSPLNPYPATSLKALFSTRQLGAVANCLRVLRASDSTQRDIGFVGGNFDVATYNAFIAGTQGFVTKWYDQSGAGLDASAVGGVYPSLLVVANRAYLTFEGEVLNTASSPAANGDQTVGFAGWSGTGAGQQIPMGDFAGGNGWFLLANHGAVRNPGYYCTGGTYTDAINANMMAKMPMRWAAKRTSGALAVTLNGVSAASAPSGQTNPATGSVLAIGGYGTTPSWQGIICEAYVYSAALNSTVQGQIDASIAAYFTGLDIDTPYAGGAASVQLGGNDLLSFGNVLQKDQGSPWTAFGAIQIWGQTLNAEVLFTNANPAPASTCYELWVDPLGRLRVRLINHFGNNIFLGVIGAANVIDGKKHIIAASYDGGSPATIANIKMYVDGVPLTTSYEQTNTLGSNSIVAAGQNMFVGTQTPGGPNMCGPISFFQIDKVARSAAYIANYYPGSATPLPPADANTDMRLLFTEASGTSVHDTSVNAFVGTLSSSGLWAP